MNYLRKIYRSLLRKPESSAEYLKRMAKEFDRPKVMYEIHADGSRKRISGEAESLSCHPEDNCRNIDYSIGIREMDIARRGPR